MNPLFRRRDGKAGRTAQLNTSTIEMAGNQILFVAQGNYWVYFGGSPRRNEASQERCRDEEQCHRAESQRIGGRDAKEQ